MATLYPPTAYPGNCNWMLPPLPLPPLPPPPPPPPLQSKTSSSRWTEEENKRFESALAIIDERRPDRWDIVAEMIPGKSVTDVINQYKELVADVSNIEAGLFPLPPPPAASSSSFTLELMEHHRGFDSLRKRGRTSSSSSSDQERKKGIPWTEEEHRRFLLGLQAHGKGDWRNISRNFVMSKTPTQVASHAQKYFLRQLSGGKDKKRPSIHDITTVHLPTTGTSCSNDHHHNKISSPSSENPSPSPAPASAKLQFDWNNSNDELLMVFDSSHDNKSVPLPTGSLLDIGRGYGRGHYATNICTVNSKFQIQPTKYVHG